ncbi:unnamed protein product [Onchocerca flexuosa]|uniref:ALG11_N domain-containing protein n=1 Tax=Onchocerca flexuosa TaxID=387005 RepID=A0A183HW78_9BILA|nr:unnamed protein product [Onchocerca flexuosa]
MGYPFALPLFRWLAGCNVACYVHYPVISREMIKLVESAEPSYNNAQWIAKNRFFTYLKLIYYRVFATLYSFSGICSEVIMVNGTYVFDLSFLVFNYCHWSIET